MRAHVMRVVSSRTHTEDYTTGIAHTHTYKHINNNSRFKVRITDGWNLRIYYIYFLPNKMPHISAKNKGLYLFIYIWSVISLIPIVVVPPSSTSLSLYFPISSTSSFKSQRLLHEGGIVDKEEHDVISQRGYK